MKHITPSLLRRKALLSLAGLGAAAALPVRAQTGEVITMVLPFSAGGPTDAVARSITQSMSINLGVPIVVENRVGASGTIASAFVAKARPDGNTLLYHTSSFTLEAALNKNLQYDPLNDFTYIGLTTTTPLVLLVKPDFPGKTPGEFIAAMKANPGKFNYGAVLRSIVHVAPEQLFHSLGVKAVAVPYKGTAPAMVDLMGGHLTFAFDAINSALPHIQSGRLRAIAIASRERLSMLPDVPTFAETVLPDFEAGTWGGIMAPAGLEQKILARLHQALSAVLENPAFRHQLESQGLRILGGSPEQARDFIQKEISRWKQVAANANIPVE